MGTIPYRPPTVTDHGDLLELTLGCGHGDCPDLMFPADPDGWPATSPCFGTP
jgi:hypothetical protein